MKMFSIFLEIVDITHSISIFCQGIRVISVTFCYIADKLESGENILSQGKFKLQNNEHPDEATNTD